MIFESLWPLLFLCAVPVIIILYLLKPRGKDQKIASNLLWQKLFRNQESKTFFEKFVHNILMYLQILIVVLLAVALMSPYVSVNGKSGGHVVFVIDTSASMQHVNEKGVSRLEESVHAACSYVDASDQTGFSVVTSDMLGAEILVISSTDKGAVKSALKSIQCSDASGNLETAVSTVEALYNSGEEGKKANVIVFTDGSGKAGSEVFEKYMQAEVTVVGEETANLSNDFLSYAVKDGAYDVACGITNRSNYAAACEVSLYDGENKLLQIKQVTVEPNASAMCLFSGIVWEGESLKSTVSAIRFDGGKKTDSLAADNTSYVLKAKSNQAHAVLIGKGNTYLEKAFRAATGETVVKSETDRLTEAENYNVLIYDAGAEVSDGTMLNRLVFGEHKAAAGELKNVMLTASAGSLTSGLSDYQIGVNRASYFELPEWGSSFLEYDGKCVGYFGEHDGVKEVIVGFDIRESDFPLKAEFPIFISNVMKYLSDSSLLTANSFEAGETVTFQPQSDFDVSTLSADTKKTGLYTVTAGERKESYVVRFATAQESDGRAVAESVTGTGEFTELKVKRTLRQVFLILALILFVIEWLVYVRQMRYRGKFYLAVRLVGTLCLLLAIFGFSVRLGRGKNTTVFVVDISNSNLSHVEEMNAYLRKKISEKPGKNQYGIVAFGKNSQIEQFLTENHFFSEVMSMPDPSATNLEEAVSRALAMIPPNSSGRIVILSDGKETKGDLNNTAKAITANRVELLSVLYETPQTKDAYIESVAIPAYLHPGDEYSITVRVESNYDTDAVIDLKAKSITLQSTPVHLNKGSNRFVIKQKVTGENIENLEVVVTAPEDTCKENDVYHTFSVVESPPQVLVVSGMEEDSTNFATMLTAAGCNYQICSAINAPDDLSGMLQYKSIVLENVYMGDLPDGFLKHLDSYVKDYGCGVICCGGEDSFALGGYRGTVIEDVLPVSMDPREENEIPSMAMVMIIDHSGSMSVPAGDGSGLMNLDLAIKAATVAVDNLRATDYVGVLTFDDQFSWQVGITQASDKKAINDTIKQIPEGGGTTIKPAIREAFRAIKACDTSIKHVVLLSDGEGETTNYSDIIRDFEDSGVTLSTVALGEDSDQRLLKTLAESCGGRYYYSDISSDIPKIFAQEVFLGGNSFIQNGDFGLSVRSGHPLVQGLFERGWPNIYGYIASSPKTASTVVIASDQDDPVLTTWQYGLGRTVAWNTDVTNEWTGAYAGRDDYAAFWKRVLDFTAGNATLGEDAVSVHTAGGRTTVHYSTEEYGDRTKVTAVYTAPDGTVGEAPLHAVGPGEYEAELDTDSIGIYNLSIRKINGEEIANAIHTAAAVQFSDEYRFDVKNDSFLSFVNRYGKVVEPDAFVWSKLKNSVREKYDLTVLMMILTLLIFLFDVAVRRFCFVPADTKLYQKMAAKHQARVAERSARRAAGRRAGGSTSGTGRADAAGGRSATNGSGADMASGGTSGASPVTTTEDYGTSADTKAAKKAAKSKPAKKKEEPATLDTSQLLKKKDDRKI